MPLKIKLLCFATNTKSLWNTTIQPPSQNFPILSRFTDFNFGNKCTILPLGDNHGMSRDADCVASIVFPSGSVTAGPKRACLRLEVGALTLK